MEIILAALEQEAADETALDETFDLERDDTRELPIPDTIDDDEWTQPYQLGAAPRALW